MTNTYESISKSSGKVQFLVQLRAAAPLNNKIIVTGEKVSPTEIVVLESKFERVLANPTLNNNPKTERNPFVVGQRVEVFDFVDSVPTPTVGNGGVVASDWLSDEMNVFVGEGTYGSASIGIYFEEGFTDLLTV